MAQWGDVAIGPLDAEGRPWWELRCGRWEDALADVERVDAVITDPPYSERTENGFRTGRDLQARGLGYDPITAEWINALVTRWSAAAGWMLVCGDHISCDWARSAMGAAGRYVFPPVPITKIAAAPRLHADGPASQSEWIAVSRPRAKAFCGTWPGIPGWYAMRTVHGRHGVSGAKSVDVMRAIVRDYSRPGDLVCDLCVGSGTTLIAAVTEGRRAIGAEMDPATFDLAVKRLRRGWTPDLFARAPQPAREAEQKGFFDDGSDEEG